MRAQGDSQDPSKARIEESNGEVSEVDEGDIHQHDSKSFGAQASKFETQPNKKKNKVIIVDEEEEKEFGVSTSINNHISIGSIEDQEQRLLVLAQNYNGSGIINPNYLLQFGASGRAGGFYGQEHTLERIKSALHPGLYAMNISAINN